MFQVSSGLFPHKNSIFTYQNHVVAAAGGRWPGGYNKKRPSVNPSGWVMFHVVFRSFWGVAALIFEVLSRDIQTCAVRCPAGLGKRQRYALRGMTNGAYVFAYR